MSCLQKFLVRVSFLVLLCGLASACATKTFQTTTELKGEQPKILLVEPDVTLSELSAGGVNSIKADWSLAAKQHIQTHLQTSLLKRGAKLVLDSSFSGNPSTDLEEIQLNKLHQAIGNTISMFQLPPAVPLPTKTEFDWSMGPAVRHYKQKYDADYALFVHVRDSYSSPGRAALILGAALFGVSVQGGIQTGFASLVDMETGQFVWYNRLRRSVGDLRKEKPAVESVEMLLDDFPEAKPLASEKVALSTGRKN